MIWDSPVVVTRDININIFIYVFIKIQKFDILLYNTLHFLNTVQPIPVAARSKTWVWGRLLAHMVGSNPTSGMDVVIFWMLCVVR